MTTNDDEDELLRSVALKNASSILIARQRAEQRSEFYLTEGQRLAQMGSWALNAAGFFDYWSPELFRIHGLDPALGAPELKEYLASVHTQDRQVMTETIEKMCDGSGCDVKHRIVRPDGEPRYVRWVGVPLSDAAASTGVVGIAMDVTEQEHLAQELRRREAFLAEAQRLSHTGSFGWSLSTGEIVWSEETFRIFQCDCTTKPTIERLLQRVHPADAALVKQTVARAAQDGKDFEHEYRLVMPDGSVKYVHVVAHSVVDAAGGLELVGAVMDVTAAKRAEARLRESEEQWRDVFENNPTMYFIVDSGGTVVAVNPYGAEQLGYEMAELVGQQVLGILQEPDREWVKDNVARCLKQLGLPRSWEARKVRKDGTVIWVRETARAVPRAHGPLVLIACENITEQKRAEEALRQAQADLAHVSRVTTLGEMAASIAHEVDQPLSGVVINANACLRFLTGPSPNLDEVRDGLHAIARDGRRASEVIARIRTLARRAQTDKEPLDINDVIGEVVALAEGEARRARASVRTELAGTLPRVLGDRVQMQQVVLNLLLNGLDAMHDVVDRPRELVIRTERDAADRVRVAVRDSGSGIDPQRATRMFDAFYTTKPGGMGMGLSISRSIVEQHGGRLWAVPNEGPGTTFQFTV